MMLRFQKRLVKLESGIWVYSDMGYGFTLQEYGFLRGYFSWILTTVAE